MTSGSSNAGFVSELIQSRNASAPEALAIFRAQMNAFKLRLAAVRGDWLIRVALLVGVGVVGAFLLSAANAPWMENPVVALSLFTLCAGVCLHIWMHYYYKRCAEVYRECFKADRRFRIENDGMIATSASGVVSSIPWTAISDIVADKDSLMIYLSPAEAISLPKAACESQNVERFCSELQRRWQRRVAQAKRGACA
jgi:hypothetical protein